MYVLVDSRTGKIKSDFETFEEAQTELNEQHKSFRAQNKICTLEIVQTDSIEELEDEMTLY